MNQDYPVLPPELVEQLRHSSSAWLDQITRPKPPNLKEQALSEVAGAIAGGNITPERGAIIRRALEQL